MKKGFMLAVALAGVMAPALAWGQSSKNVIQVGDLSLLSQKAAALDADGFQTVMRASLKTANQSDAIVSVSVEAGLFTSTTVKSKGGNADTSSAEAMVEMRVLIDGAEAYPGIVIFARRYQELMAKFGGIVDSCTDLNGDGTISFATECLISDEELRLVLDTMGAHSFNFMLPDLSSGQHEIEVQARLSTNASWQAGAAEANAVIGKGSVTVEEVRFIKDLDFSL